MFMRYLKQGSMNSWSILLVKELTFISHCSSINTLLSYSNVSCHLWACFLKEGPGPATEVLTWSAAQTSWIQIHSQKQCPKAWEAPTHWDRFPILILEHKLLFSFIPPISLLETWTEIAQTRSCFLSLAFSHIFLLDSNLFILNLNWNQLIL